MRASRARRSSSCSRDVSETGRPRPASCSRSCRSCSAELFAREVPDDGAQLRVGVEAQPVVDSPHLSGRVEQAVATLAVGVVGDHVEGGHLLEGGVVGFLLQEGEVVLLEVRVDEQLQRPGVKRAVVARHRLGDQPPSEGLGQLVGRHLPAVQAVGEVPKRPFRPTRLVDRHCGRVTVGDRDQIGAVAAPGHAPLDLDSACGQELQGSGGRWPLVRGHEWPSGSMG